MNRHETIETDLKEAMRARDRARMSALRMLIAALKNRAIADGLGAQGRLADSVVEQVVSTEVKRRREAAEAYAKAGRAEQAASEQAEADIYAAYLPEPLSDDELAALIAEAIATEQAQGLQDLGNVMKVVMAQVGNRADGSRVSAMVRQALASGV